MTLLLAPGAGAAPADAGARSPADGSPDPHDSPQPAGEAGTDAPDEEPRTSSSERIVVFGRAEQEPRGAALSGRIPGASERAPVFMTVLPAPQIEARGPGVLGDVLEAAAGLFVQPGSRAFDAFLIRGFDSLSSALVLTDVAPEPEASFHDLYNVDRVEVLRGPAGFLVGGGTMAGAVNLVRKRPLPEERLAIETTAGSYETLGARVDWNRPGPGRELGFRLNGLVRSGGDFRDRIEREVAAVNPVFTWRPGARTMLDISLEAVSSEAVPDAGLPLVGGRLPAVPRRRNLASARDVSEQQIYRADVTWETRLAGPLTLRQRLWYRTLDWTSTGTLFSGVAPSPEDPGSLLVFRNLLQLDDRQDFFGGRVEAVWTGTAGGLTHRVVAGLELARQADEFTLGVAGLSPVDAFSPAEADDSPPTPIPGLDAAGDSRSDVVAPFVMDQVALSERFDLLVGLRYDAMEIEDRLTGDSRSDGELSPMVGLSWSPREDATAWASYSGSFAPPSPRVTGVQRPEESQQWELGVRGRLADGRLRGALAVYSLERENIAIPDDTGFLLQTGDQRSRGAELEVAVDVGSAATVALAYAYNDAELTEFAERVFTGLPPTGLRTVDRSGNAPAFAPRHLARAWIARELSTRVTAEGGVRYVGEHFAAEDNAATIDSYALAELAVTYDGPPWRVRLGIENLTDEEHELRALNGAALIPGPPRTWLLTVGLTR